MEKRGTLYTEVMDVDGETWVDAFHVCPLQKAQLIKTNGTAGGVAGADKTVGAPKEHECVQQVKFERAPWAKPEQTAPRVVVEFGVGAPPGYSGGQGSVVAHFQIQAKYLRKGSGSEGGWCAYLKAPVKWVE